MKFLEYANKTYSNIIPKEAFEELIQQVFGILAENMAKSLGPLGSNGTILHGMVTDTTKDGHTLFKNILFRNRYMNMIYNLIAAPCNVLNNTVGDGTTTAIVMANYLWLHYRYKKGLLDTLYRLPRTFTKTWDTTVADVIEKVKGYAEPLSGDDYDTIYKLCYVVSNGDEEISKNIADVYKIAKSPVIKLKDSPTNKSYVNPITGFEFPANMIADAYVKNEDLSVTHKNIAVLLFGYKIETDVFNDLIVPLNDIFRNQGKRLLILAPSYDRYLVETYLQQYINLEFQKFKDLNLIAAQYNQAQLEPHQLTDLATVLRTWVINQDNGPELVAKWKELSDGDRYDFFENVTTTDAEAAVGNIFHRMIGTCDQALLSCTNGSIFKPSDLENDTAYMDALRGAEKALADAKGKVNYERQNYANEIYKAQARVSQLKMENYLYYIGADSALQQKITHDAVEDVVKCIRSAVKSGTVPGCQLSIIRACNELTNEINKSLPDPSKASDDIKLRQAILDIIKDAVFNVYKDVLYGPEMMGMVKLLDRWQHTDMDSEEAVKALREAAQQKCVSIMNESVDLFKVFDLETLEHNGNIITSAETDTMVLTASSELVKLLISGNQCIFRDTELDEAQDRIVEAYV